MEIEDHGVGSDPKIITVDGKIGWQGCANAT
jgi:hypothetical protein